MGGRRGNLKADGGKGESMDVNRDRDGSEQTHRDRDRDETNPSISTEFEAPDNVRDDCIHDLVFSSGSPVRGRQYTATNTDCDSHACISRANATRRCMRRKRKEW